MDIEAMMGLGVTDDQRMQALADRLRGRRQAADVFAMSTIQPLARAAQGEQAQIQATAEGVAALRNARQAQAAKAEQAALDRASREDIALADRESREAIAGIKSGTTRPTAAQKTAQYRAETFAQGLSDMRELIAGGFDPTSVGALKDKVATRYDPLRWAASKEGEQWQSATNTVKEAALRTATGAAAPEGENRDYIITLIPQPFEARETVEFKMRKLEEFLAMLNELGGVTDAEAAANFNTAAESIRMDSGIQDVQGLVMGTAQKPVEEMSLEELQAELGVGNP